MPPNLHYLYFDCIEDKRFTQIKIEMFSSVLRMQIEGFMRQRARLIEKTDGKKIALKI